MAFINRASIYSALVLAWRVTSAAAASSVSSTSVAPTPLPSTSSAPPTTNTDSPNNNNGGGNSNNNNNPNTSQSSPLLFFVALGFGVVFTNLWIIVGVKYCFRYNARSRQMRLTEDGEPITLENMPRPHRRRREKKLMTIDEVNEKFPMVKYKNWVASRAKEGLPTQGGVSAPPSRANSVRSVEGAVPELPPKERDASDNRPATSPDASAAINEKPEPSHQPKESTSGSVENATDRATEGQTSAEAATEAPLPKVPARISDEHDLDDDEDDEHINAALPPECLGNPGDTCAICIDGIEDDDDVRGLTCGHAFHAVCLDPWLTSRRACCPLCKADYYVPKPRPPAPEGAEGTTTTGVIAVSLAGDGRHRMNLPSRPQTTWIGIRGNGRMFPARFIIRTDDHVVDRPNRENSAPRRLPFFSRSQPAPATPRQNTTPGTSPTTSQASPATGSGNSWFGKFRSGFPPFRLNQMRRQNNQPQTQNEPPMASGANPAVSPSQLEAGVREVPR